MSKTVREIYRTNISNLVQLGLNSQLDTRTKCCGTGTSSNWKPSYKAEVSAVTIRKVLQVVCLVQKQWIHSSTSRAWRSESNHMKRPHIKEGTSWNWGRFRRTSLSANGGPRKTKHSSERSLHLLSNTTVCLQLQRKKKSIQNLVHGCDNARSYSCVSSFPSPSLVCYVSDNVLPASSRQQLCY